MVLDVALAHCMKAKIFQENKIAQNFEHFFETERQPADSAYLQDLPLSDSAAYFDMQQRRVNDMSTLLPVDLCN